MIFTRKYGASTSSGTHIRIPIIKRGAVDFAVGADWTPAAGDVKVSKDGGTAANIATLPAAVAMGNTAYWEFQLSSGELACKQLVVTVGDSATKAVEDQCFVVETCGNASAMYPSDPTADNTDAETRLTNALKGTVYGVVGSSATTTSIPTSSLSPAAGVTDQFKGRIMTFAADTTTANLRGQSREITGSASGGTLTTAAFTTAPASGDTFSIT